MAMTFTEAYNYLTSLANIPRKQYMNDPKSCEIYLKRLQFFLDILGNPEKNIPHYIHVTGTSGKGSVTAFLHSILHESGKKVGSSVSPHPTTITQRWKIGPQEMPEDLFVSIMEQIMDALEIYTKTSPYDMVSFYEITEAIGMLWFAQEQVEWVVVEVGCGGRYDSSNIIPHKDAAIITNIGLDHVGIIGNTKAEIAHEKAGIITGPNQPVFTMEQDPSLREIIEKEGKQYNNVTTCVKNTATAIVQTPIETSFTWRNNRWSLPTIGKHQIHNALLCITVATALGISESDIQTGLQKAVQPIRMELCTQQPLCILDAAHNEAKIASSVQTIQDVFPDKNIHLLIGFSQNKNIDAMVAQLASLNVSSVACTRNTNNPFRPVIPPAALMTTVLTHIPNATVEQFLDPKRALAWSKTQQAHNDVLLVTGSVFLAGEIRAEIIR